MKLTTSFRIDESTLSNLKHVADKEDRTVSYIMQRMLDNGIVLYKKNPTSLFGNFSELKTEND